MVGWRVIRFNHNTPCPICQKAGDNTYCFISSHGDAVYCGRVHDGPLCLIGQPGFERTRLGQTPHSLPQDTDVLSLPAARPPAPKKSEDTLLWMREKMLAENGQRERHFKPFMEAKGISYKALRAYGALWSNWHNALTIPCYNDDGVLCGMRTWYSASEGVRKGSVRGSVGGSFRPSLDAGGPTYYVEGDSDALAMHMMGFHAIGRWSAGMQTLLDADRHATIYVVPDAGEVGARGAAQQVVHLRENKYYGAVPLDLPEGYGDVREILVRNGVEKGREMVGAMKETA